MNETHTHHVADTHPAAVVTELLVSGMNCNNCARHVTEALQGVPGVRNASVMLEAGRASVRWAAGSPVDVAAALAAIKRAGYEAKALEAAAREQGESGGAGPAGWQLNLWLGVLGTAPLMAGEWIFGLGGERWFQWVSFVLAGAVQVFAGAPFYRGAWRQLKLGRSNMDTLVALGSTTAFGYSAWALLSGQGGHVYFMEAAAIITLISVGHWLEARVSARASSALQSLLHLAPPTARRLSRSRGSQPEEAHSAKPDMQESLPQNGDSAKAASSPRPSPPGEEREEHATGVRGRQATPSGTLLVSGATEEEVPVADLKIGDLVALRPGEHVPTDGIVLEGESAVDETMLTGESVPVDKTARSELYAGTVNLNGRLVMEVTATGESTALAHIIAAVQRAQTSRADIQRLGDRVSSVFVPVVVLIALAAGLWWGLAPESAGRAHAWLEPFLWPGHLAEGALATAFITAAAVLIIACPCAMGLATPAAIMASANAAAARGILIRDGVALEKAGGVSAVVLDKTGTLTSGRLAIAGPWTPEDTKTALQLAPKLAASLARQSNHPISKVVATLSDDFFALENWREVAGSGLQAQWRSEAGEWKLARLGSLSWLRQNGVGVPEPQGVVESWSGQGSTLIGLAVENSLVAIFALRDFLKPGAPDVVRQLQRQGLKTFLLTGDNSQTARAIARQAGIATENVFAGVRPEQKAGFVKELQQRGERVAFVGDGLNDAPALEQADLGIAVSRASDIAREAADIILLKSEIEAVPEALGLARATLRTIKQNLFWAFFYNAIGVPLAALGFMSPVLCAAAMGVSDLVVIGNALRLRRWRLAR